MMGRLDKSWLAIGWVWLVFSCSEDEIQTQFYDYQIERLLSAGDTAIWRPLAIFGEGRTLATCPDSIHLLIAQLTDDSLSVLELAPTCDGTSLFDTISLGKAKASAEDIFFTDSILFADGQYWIITESFSQTFGFRDGEEVSFRYIRDN